MFWLRNSDAEGTKGTNQMKILVFIKQVPETDGVRLDPKTGTLNRDNVPGIMNPYDAHAVEAALQLRERHGGSVHVITMGPPQAAAVLKEALAMGCDEAHLLNDRAFAGADSLATGYTLARAAETIGGYDLLLFGQCAVGAETAQTGPITAEYLDLPQVTLVDALSCEDGWAVCRRDLGARFQTVKVKLPALVAVTGQINRPRYPQPARIRRISTFPLTVWSAETLGCDPDRIGAAGSPSRTRKVFAPEKPALNTRYLTGTPEQIACAMADVLEAEHIL